MRDIVVIQNPQIYAYELPDQEVDLKEEIMATATQNSVEEQETTTTTSQLSDIQAVVKFCLIRKKNVC